MVRLDPIDIRIIDEYWRNARISYRELAKRVGLSTTGVMKRVNSLMESGAIREFTIMPSHAMIGAERFRATLYTDGYENEENLVDSIGSLPEVHGACRIVSARGGAYIVWGSYVGPVRLDEIGRYLRTLTGVEEVELHTVVANWSRFSNWGRGQKMELSRNHLLVLRSLRGNPRIQAKELSAETGLSLRRARRLLREIEESEAFYFIARTDPIVEGPAFVLKIQLAENEMEPQQLHEWLQDTYPEHFVGLAFSVTEPVSFVQFGGCDVPQMINFYRDIGRLPFVATTTILMALSFTGYPHLMQLKLDEMLEGLDD